MTFSGYLRIKNNIFEIYIYKYGSSDNLQKRHDIILHIFLNTATISDKTLFTH